MENKKRKIAIVILILLIIFIIVIAFFYNESSTKQIALLTTEVNKIIEANLTEDNIDFEVKTDRNYAEVEQNIKEYIYKLKNIYVEMEEMVSGINPNAIFSAQNVKNKKMDEIENIISEYKEKSQNFIAEYEELITEEKIKEQINKADFSIRRDYYINLYNEIMLSESMQSQYNKLDEKIKNEKGRLYDKLNKIDKIKEFLKEYENSWTIKDNKIQFTNLVRMTEYYNLLNQITN